MRMALVTCERPSERDEDVDFLAPALRRSGVDVETPAWSDPRVDWSGFDLVKLSSPWDYHERPDQFAAWLRAAAKASNLQNPLAIVEWNLDKRYLRELDRAGVPTIATVWSEPGAEDAAIGADALLHAGVRIGARVRIGDRFIAQPGAVIGADGFSYVTPSPGVVEEARGAGVISARERAAYVRVNSLGGVRIGDDVEVGANACIDRGTIADTTVGDGTKIDNLVMVGHNVRVGRGCLLCGHTGIAGSATIGDGCVLGGRASIADHAVLGKGVVITGNAAVSGHVPDGRIMMGYPGVRRDEFVAMWKALRRLPRTLARLEAAQKPVPKADASD